jgi:hypothetical protein
MDYYLFLFYFEEHLKFYEILCISYNLIYDMYVCSEAKHMQVSFLASLLRCRLWI